MQAKAQLANMKGWEKEWKVQQEKNKKAAAIENEKAEDKAR